MTPLKETAVRRGRVFPILITGAERKGGGADFKVLAEVSMGKNKSPVALRQITVLESQTNWSMQEARAHLVNESSLSLRRVILNTHNLHNPMKHWEDAVWFHRWVEDGLGASHCIIMVFIPIIPKEVSLQKPERYKWEQIHEEVRNFILSTADMGDTVRIEDSMALMMKIFLGENLFDLEPSPARPSLKKQRSLATADDSSHQLGCGKDTDDVVGLPQPQKSQRFTAE